MKSLPAVLWKDLSPVAEEKVGRDPPPTTDRREYSPLGEVVPDHFHPIADVSRSAHEEGDTPPGESLLEVRNGISQRRGELIHEGLESFRRLDRNALDSAVLSRHVLDVEAAITERSQLDVLDLVLIERREQPADDPRDSHRAQPSMRLFCRRP